MSSEDEEFFRQLQAAFQIEASEHLQVLETGLLELETLTNNEKRPEVIETIYREAHSLKGAARAVDLADIETVCQSLETLFSAWKRQQMEPDITVFDALHRALALVEMLLTAARGEQAAPERRQITEVTQRIDSVRAPSRDARTAPIGVAPSEPVSEQEPAARSEVSVPAARAAPVETVRISTAKLEALLRQAEELLVLKQAAGQLAGQLRETQETVDRWARARQRFHAHTQEDSEALLRDGEGQAALRSVRSQVSVLTRSAEQDHREISAKVDTLLQDTKLLLMLPFSTLLAIFPKMVRDLARDEGKEIQFSIHGGEVEIDKRILEELKDPLIHLVRNAVGHGIEMPEVRERFGKPRRAVITLTVTQVSGSEVEIALEDDGGGIDADRVKASAVQHGVISGEEARRMGEERAVDLIFQSDVSTSPVITELSGRGLGMAIVREKVEKLGGWIKLRTRFHEGTRFQILLPLTLATFKGIIVRAAGQTFVIPTSDVERVLRVSSEAIQTVENRPAILVNDRLVPIVRLEELLGLSRPDPPSGPSVPLPLLLLGAADKRVALRVSEIVDEQEVLVKAFSKPLVRVRHLAGATILGSGTPVPLLNTADLVQSALRPGASQPGGNGATAVPAIGAPQSILVAEDSITSRMLLKNILETAGYQVTTAVDGQDALAALKMQPFSLVVSDVDMPRMDGFTLTAQIRADAALRDMPVILVTARNTREDRERGVDAGASAYLVKSSFDQSNLLSIVQRLI